MSKLFASHLLQTTKASFPVEGHYDSEQELWVGDNLLRGITITHYTVVSHWTGTTYVWNGCSYGAFEDTFTEDDDDEDEV